MNKEIFDKVVELVTPFAKNKAALETVTAESSFLKDLQVSSSRLVDIILALEDTFGIEVGDDEADKVETIGAAVQLIESKSA
jgi:acyl carrier protein